MALGYAPRLAKPATISFNDKIRIKLTDVGRKMHRDWFTGLIAGAGCAVKDFPYVQPPVGEDGCCEFVLWEAANIFGPKLANGAEPPFEISCAIVPLSAPDATPSSPTGGYLPKGREVDLS